MKVTELVKELIKKVLGRDENFTLVLRKSAQRRYARDSAEVLVQPLEVTKTVGYPYYKLFSQEKVQNIL